MQPKDDQAKILDRQAQVAATFPQAERSLQDADRLRPSYRPKRPVLGVPFLRN